MLKKAGIPIAFIYDDENDNSRGQKIAVIRISDFEAFKNARMQLQPK
jgi:glutamate formiminotransferase